MNLSPFGLRPGHIATYVRVKSDEVGQKFMYKNNIIIMKGKLD